MAEHTQGKGACPFPHLSKEEHAKERQRLRDASWRLQFLSTDFGAGAQSDVNSRTVGCAGEHDRWGARRSVHSDAGGSSGLAQQDEGDALSLPARALATKKRKGGQRHKTRSITFGSVTEHTHPVELGNTLVPYGCKQRQRVTSAVIPTEAQFQRATADGVRGS